jgi:hypothetical protein
MSPAPIVLLAVKRAQYSKFPVVKASKMPKATMVPHPDGVAVGYVMTPLFVVTLGVPLGAPKAIASRAYALPDTSAPVGDPEVYASRWRCGK